ncbi:hypothetical protein [Brevibacillus laterosporus]|uniref:hypothetical protein n=1 Tax=Brevibacillus laterosporus TaxID=1465 RepID=UPI003D1FB9D2
MLIRGFNVMSYWNEAPKLLAKHYRKMGLNEQEFVVLSCFLTEENDKWTTDHLARITGYKEYEINTIIRELIERNVLFQRDEVIDLHKLLEFLVNFHLENRSLYEKLLEDYELNVSILPDKKSGGLFLARETQFSEHFKIEDISVMKQVIDGLSHFISNYSQAEIDEHNSNASKLVEQKNKHLREEYDRRRVELENKRQKKIPKSGYVSLFRTYPSGLYKFTRVTTSLEHKREQLKLQFGDHTEIVHSIRVTDVDTIYYFLLKTFDDKRKKENYFDLTIEDVVYIKDQVFPPDLAQLLD